MNKLTNLAELEKELDYADFFVGNQRTLTKEYLELSQKRGSFTNPVSNLFLRIINKYLSKGGRWK